MEDSAIIEELEPRDAFGILSDETRIEILRALWEADGEAASFSELRDAVGVRDSGKFNYHLGKLTDRFVDKTDSEYELRPAGRHVVGSLLAGGYTMTADVDPIEIDDPCPICGETMTFSYEHEHVLVECGTCPFTTQFSAPPGAFAGYEVDRFPAVAGRYLRTILAQLRNGFCVMCDGRVRPELTPLWKQGSYDPPTELADTAMVAYECDRCGANSQCNLGNVLRSHPAVVSFHYEHGVDIRDLSFWQFGATGSGFHSHLLERDPARATVTYAVDDASLTLTVNDALEAVDVDGRDSR